MKAIKFVSILGCLFALSLHAQEKETNCEFNFKEALFYLKGDANFAKDSLKSVRLLKPCIEKGYDKAQVLMGRLYQAQKTAETDQKAFALYQLAAKQGNAMAMADLGILYKYGRGCKLNFNKARKWFTKSAKLGNHKAAYSLGYLYLKGFGTITQNYTKAVNWFKKSEHPMASYWLGVCYLKGYGVTKDVQKASELLGETSTNNNFKETNTSTTSSTEEVEKTTALPIENAISSPTIEKEITEDFLLGEWTGTILKLDWSKKQLEAKKDIAISFLLDTITGTLQSKIRMDEKVIEDAILKMDETIYFENTRFSLPHESYKKEIPNNLEYTILSSDLQLKTVNGIPYLIANIESYIKNWNEAGAPLRLVLKKKETFTNTDKELSNDALIALSQQEDNFIKLYPNPFQEDLIISYVLAEQATIKVQLNDLQGNIKEVIADNKIQEKGDYRYFLDGSNLKKGAYVISVFVNNQRKTRVIIKK